MSRVPLHNVRVLTLREIAEMWAPEAEVPVSLMLRELRLAVVNIPRRWEGLDHIPADTPDEQLPDPDEKVDRQWLMEFCDKQEGWREPSFWQREKKESERYPGRPSVKPAILQKLKDRADAGEMAQSLADEARQLLAWATETYQGQPGVPSKSTSIENQIRATYRELREKAR